MVKIMMNSKFKIYNATELWQKETSLPSIPTFSRRLDDILGSKGIQLGSITELLGLPGTGKTQLCLQLCASVQIPKTLGGLDADALYIDTNTNFTLTRFREMLEASVMKCQQLLDSSYISLEESLKRLHYVNAFGLEKFCGFIHRLPEFLEERPNIRLIVIDSIVFPFKEGVSAQQRTGLLFRQMALLHRAARERQIAIVLTNEMSTRLGLSGGSIVGAMGDAWSHRCNTRLLLSQDKQGRAALLLKSGVAACGAAGFQITTEGIRDIE